MSIIKDFEKRGMNPARLKKIQKGKTNFREYCKAINPDFFKADRTFQDEVCDTIQKIYEGKLINPITKKPYDILVINLPPGHGKSYTVGVFTTWAFGQDISNQVITVSYNQTLSTRFAKMVRDHIQDKEITGDNYYVVNSFFPEVKIKDGDGAMNIWSLEGAFLSYLATSFDGSITGMRGNIGIIDDPIKNKEEAVNSLIKDKHWDWYKNTFLSRMVEGAIQIVIQTRWASDDLAGRVMGKFGDRCYVLEMPVLNEQNKPLCAGILSRKAIIDKKEGIDEDIFLANYMQTPIDKKGSLYTSFKQYASVDQEAFEDVIAYVDTADTGADNLCLIVAGVLGRYAYVLDIYYTDEPMEVTEGEVARLLDWHQVRNAIFESNNGGRGFARNVEKILREQLKNKKCNIQWFAQSKNKKTRILVNSANVLEQLIMPEGWSKKNNKFFIDVMKYQRKGKNKYDDGPDTMTGLVEVVNGDVKTRKSFDQKSTSLLRRLKIWG